MTGSRSDASPAKGRPDAPSAKPMDFSSLVAVIRQARENCAAEASRTVNVSLTLRNWMIGAYIHHYELSGQGRAKHGDGLLDALAERLTALSISDCNR